MEFFERAHVTRKDSSKRENKSEEAVKKQLKQMLSAYKKGNNRELKSCADTEDKYDFDDLKSVSDFSEMSFPIESKTKKTESSRETQSSLEHSLSCSNEHSTSNSDMTKSNNESTDSFGSVTEFVEEFKSLSSRDITTSDFSSTYDNSSITSSHLEDSDISIPSSLETSSGTESDTTDDVTFDPDGSLASKILEKLGKSPTPSKKRKITKEHKVSRKVTKDEKHKQVKKEVLDILPKNEARKEKKTKKKVPFSEECTDNKAFNHLETRDETDYRDINTEMMEDSFNENSILDDSLSSNNSSTNFISVSAVDMPSQSLSDIVGDYVHPTVRNMPSEKQNSFHAQSCKYAILDEIMCVDDVEELSSLVPEIDEELAMEDLTLDTDAPEVEESTVYDDIVDTEDYFEHESSTELELTSVPIKLYSGRNNYILVMKHPAELFVHGKLSVTAIGGSVEIFGYTLQDDSINIYAPYCYFAQSIKTGVNRSAFHGLFSKLASEGLTGSEAEEIITTVEEYDAILSLSKLDCAKMDFVDNNFTATELFSKRSDQTPKLLKKAAENLGCTLYLDHPKKVFTEKTSWDELVMCGMNDRSKGIICGGKGTGKSTLLRYYINRLLCNGPVLVIDLDPGQAEFTMPGNVSVSVVDSPLIGPNFTHLRKPEKALNIGMINPMDSPSRYISAVKEIITYCYSKEAYLSMPWIVNTMGMCNHMGLKFITYIILEIQPTFVYQIDSKVVKKKFEFELQSHTITELYEVNKNDRLFSNVKNPYNLDYTFILGVNEESSPGSSPHKGNNSFALSPKDERYLNVLAYFSELEVYGKNLLDIVPYEVSIRDLTVGVNVKIPEEALTKVINGKIIALCQLTAADKGKMFTLGDKALLSHGYGLIRGIDFEKGVLYILTPIPSEDLNLVNALVYADWMPELRGQEKELPSGTIVPYRTATDFHQRSLMFSPRRRFNPLQLLKATRSS